MKLILDFEKIMNKIELDCRVKPVLLGYVKSGQEVQREQCKGKTILEMLDVDQ